MYKNKKRKRERKRETIEIRKRIDQEKKIEENSFYCCQHIIQVRRLTAVKYDRTEIYGQMEQE